MNDREDEPAGPAEVLPPSNEAADGGASFPNHYLALVSNYTDRPDLLLAEIEKHDPGFVKRMNAESERGAAQMRQARFNFGRVQAYVSLGITAVAALVILYIMVRAVEKGAGFWTLVALAICFAVTQGGSVGFHKIIDSLRELFGGRKPPSD